MDLERAHFLTSADGERLLDEARASRDEPAHRRVRALRRGAHAEAVRAVLQQDDLRRRARARCPHAERLLFTAEALEQATAWPVAEERAGRWPGPPDAPLTDLGAGIGLDALAVALAGRPVEAWERDPARAHLLAHNARALGVEGRLAVHVGDARDRGLSGPLAFLDPDRRPGGRRTRRPEDFEPPRRSWDDLLAGFSASLVKLPPALPRGEAEVPFEVVSLAGRARERRLFRGDFGPRPPRRALCLPSGAAVEGPGLPWPPTRVPQEGDVLLDPDPAVTVAGLVGDLALALDLAPVHPRIAYLVGPAPAAPAAPPPGTLLVVDAVLRPRAREVDAWLRARGIGRLTVRSRGVRDDAATWRRRLHPRGEASGTVLFTRLACERWVALGAHPAPMTRE